MARVCPAFPLLARRSYVQRRAILARKCITTVRLNVFLYLDILLLECETSNCVSTIFFQGDRECSYSFEKRVWLFRRRTLHNCSWGIRATEEESRRADEINRSRSRVIRCILCKRYSSRLKFGCFYVYYYQSIIIIYIYMVIRLKRNVSLCTSTI